MAPYLYLSETFLWETSAENKKGHNGHSVGIR